MKSIQFFKIYFSLFLSFGVLSAGDIKGKTVVFKSLDGLTITADLYAPHKHKNTPFIVVFHQADWSRGEYSEIAPKLNKLGFNCLAIDQRSGGSVNDVQNETVKRAEKVSFIPKTKGNHGSRALWEKFSDSSEYGQAVIPFLKKFTDVLEKGQNLY